MHWIGYNKLVNRIVKKLAEELKRQWNQIKVLYTGDVYGGSIEWSMYQ
jgi:hypothetical protein